MSAAPFDTHATVKRLTGAGMDAALAEAVTDAISQAHRQSLADLATKADLERLEERLEGRIERLEATMKADFERLEATTRADIRDTATKTDLARLKNEMLMWFVALVLPIYGLIAVVFFAG